MECLSIHLYTVSLLTPRYLQMSRIDSQRSSNSVMRVVDEQDQRKRRTELSIRACNNIFTMEGCQTIFADLSRSFWAESRLCASLACGQRQRTGCCLTSPCHASFKFARLRCGVTTPEIWPRFTRRLPTKNQVSLYGCLAPGQYVMSFSVSRATRRRGRRLRPLAVFDP